MPSPTLLARHERSDTDDVDRLDSMPVVKGVHLHPSIETIVINLNAYMVLLPLGPCSAETSFQEAFHLATMGGAEVLGLENVVGNFLPGKQVRCE